MPFQRLLDQKPDSFFGDAIRNGEVSRRKFLQNVAIGAALVTLVNACGNGGGDTVVDPDAPPCRRVRLRKKLIYGWALFPLPVRPPLLCLSL